MGLVRYCVVQVGGRAGSIKCFELRSQILKTALNEFGASGNTKGPTWHGLRNRMNRSKVSERTD